MKLQALAVSVLVACSCTTSRPITDVRFAPLAGLSRNDLGRPCRVVVKDRVYLQFGPWPQGMVSHSGTRTTIQGILTDITDKKLEVQAAYSGIFTDVKRVRLSRRNVLAVEFLDQR
jgi:hypothetical protein